MPDAAEIDRLRTEFDDQLARLETEREWQALRDRFLGRRGGIVSSLYAELGKLPPEARREIGRLANELRAHVEAGLAARKDGLAAKRERAAGPDLTLPGRVPFAGTRHPLTIVRERIEDIFARMGYEILDGPEAEDDYPNFEALNMPPEHPARDMQDTLYLEAPLVRDPRTRAGDRQAPAAAAATLLRTHTSSMQIRYMETHEPPVRVIAPGRVYRRDNLDLTHTPMFQQVEGLVVGDDVTMGDLKGTIEAFLRQLFAPDTPVLFRPSFFPYTEPSAEVFIGCVQCGGAGCSMCKRTGWLEIMGCGMVHPAVFEAVGYDAERVTGFAFGLGIERVALLKYGVEDIRQFYENDLRFLEQFGS